MVSTFRKSSEISTSRFALSFNVCTFFRSEEKLPTWIIYRLNYSVQSCFELFVDKNLRCWESENFLRSVCFGSFSKWCNCRTKWQSKTHQKLNIPIISSSLSDVWCPCIMSSQRMPMTKRTAVQCQITGSKSNKRDVFCSDNGPDSTHHWILCNSMHANIWFRTIPSFCFHAWNLHLQCKQSFEVH